MLIACDGGRTAPAASPPVGAAAVPIAHGEPIDIRDPALELLAAFELQGREPAFGGISAALVDGPDLLLLSDRGTLFRTRLVLEDSGRLVALHDWRSIRLREGSPRAPDSEGITRAVDGSLMLSIEDEDHLARLGVSGLERGPPLPPSLAGLPENEGVESLATLPDGRLLAIGEGGSVAGNHPAALIGPGEVSLRTVPVDMGFKPTGADIIDEALVMVERRVSLLGGLAGRLVSQPVASLDGEATWPPALTLAVLDGEIWGENWEAVALDQRHGSIMIYVVSDNNFSALQKTLLMQFRWTPRAG